MKKSILFLLALFSVTMTTQATDYYYRGEKNSWDNGQKLEVSTDTYYSYIHFDAGAEHQFKICEHATDWNQPNYGKTYNDVGFNGTDVTELGDHWGGDNCKIWSSKAHYILVYHPNTKINTTSKVKICASTFLPDDSETDLPEPEPEPTELTYNVTVPAGTNVCYICGNMTGWKFNEMTKVDDTHYTITIEGAKKDDGYKYASGSDWGYVEKDANGNEIGNRTYVDGNDVVAKWAAVYEPDAVEQELTYSVTVPEGTHTCYIAMDTDPESDGWEFTEMTKVDDTHYTFVRTGLKNKTYKYASGPSWDYVEKTSENGDVADRQWAENDVVAKWNDVYNPTPTYDVTTTATVSTQGQNIVLSGSWEEKALTVMLWQGGATQGFGTYAAEDYAPIFLGAAELTPTSEGVYADNSDGTFTFTATATDSEGAIYNITLTGDNPVVEPEYKEWEGSVLFTEEEGTLSISYAASDWSWFLELYIENYTGYGTYEVSDVYYGDFTGDYYGMSGSVTIGYDEDAETDVLYADLTSGDGTLKVWATLYNEEPVAAEYDVVITNATVTENTSGYYIDMTGEWDGHTIKVEVCDELTADNILANFFIDGGIINGGNQAEGTVEATVSGGIVTITGTFECMGTGDVYHVTISGTLPDNLTTAVDNLNATVAPVKMINNGQLVIIKNGVQYNAQGAVVK